MELRHSRPFVDFPSKTDHRQQLLGQEVLPDRLASRDYTDSHLCAFAGVGGFCRFRSFSAQGPYNFDYRQAPGLIGAL
jgi:hypothetical protein